jgi:heme-degrading monooxygenase HmoA
MNMIARVWRCTGSRDKAADYLAHFEHSVAEELNSIDGYRGAYVLRRDLDDGVELTVQTLWESIDAIRAFAGEQIEQAVVAPAAQTVLRSYDLTVTHYEVLLKPQ